MKNTSTRLRIINAFKRYSRLGLASGRLDALDAYERIKGCSRTRREARELIAVYETVKYLEICGKKECIEALCEIYFSLSGRAVRKSEISERVLRYASDNYLDERTVYRRLSYAVKIYEKYLSL